MGERAEKVTAALIFQFSYVLWLHKLARFDVYFFIRLIVQCKLTDHMPTRVYKSGNKLDVRLGLETDFIIYEVSDINTHFTVVFTTARVCTSWAHTCSFVEAIDQLALRRMSNHSFWELV